MKEYSVKTLIATYKASNKWHPDMPFVKTDWHTVLTAMQWREWFLECLNHKINREMVYTGKKYSEEWQLNCWRLAKMINSRAVVRERDLNGMSQKYKTKLVHRIEGGDI